MPPGMSRSLTTFEAQRFPHRPKNSYATFTRPSFSSHRQTEYSFGGSLQGGRKMINRREVVKNKANVIFSPGTKARIYR